MEEDSKKMNDATILVVDDTEQNIKLLQHVIRNEGYNTLAASSGEEALKMANNNNPDLILLDVMMPGMDGFEVCQKLKDDGETTNIPVIFLSALTETDSKVQGFKVGGVDYITKPFQRQEVVARINLHLNLRRLEQEREDYIAELKRRERNLNILNREKDEVMRIVSHDIRNPVTGIIGLANLLQSEGAAFPDDERKRMLSIIEESGQKLQELVNQMLKADSVQKNRLELNLEECDPRDLVRGVINLHKPTATTKKIELTQQVDEELEKVVWDEPKMDQVLSNLVSNALKFTPEGGTVSIELTTTSNQENGKPELLFKVSDTGIGIPEKDIATLFDHTHQRRRVGTGGEKGSGMGLDIVRDYIEMHDGRISVESGNDHGTTFFIKLPYHHDVPAGMENE